MPNSATQPQVFHVLKGEARKLKRTPFGTVGTLFSREGIEAVWVSKRDEARDPGWFSQPMIDLIVLVAGRLRVEYENTDTVPVVLGPGDLLVLPANTRCRAYRWPRKSRGATVFVAVYPAGPGREGD
ncbi:MAG TPA: hypothetical protein VGR94_00255 [Candidatus Acidoferrales bacterium]|nr:hypothetical protein [Candidatus Acidoferrales bacterium]